LNELFNVLSIKLKLKSKAETKEIIQNLIDTFEVSIITNNVIMKAIDISIKYQFRFFDCLMIAVALHENCNLFFSEDLQNNQLIDNRLKIVNPLK